MRTNLHSFLASTRMSHHGSPAESSDMHSTERHLYDLDQRKSDLKHRLEFMFSTTTGERFFPQFTKLPTEIQMQVWEHAAYEPYWPHKPPYWLQDCILPEMTRHLSASIVLDNLSVTYVRLFIHYWKYQGRILGVVEPSLPLTTVTSRLALMRTCRCYRLAGLEKGIGEHEC